MNSTTRKISLDHPTTPGLSPLQVIALADTLKCDAVSLRMVTHPAYPDVKYDLVNDHAMQVQIREEIEARGMFLALGSGFEINPDTKIADLQPALDALGWMGAKALSVVVYDKDKSRHQDRVTELAERSGALGIRSLIEYFALSGVDGLEYGVDLVKRVDNTWLGLGADSLHFTRTGTTPAQLAAVPKGMIGHAQVNDGPLHMPHELQMDEARGGRLLPGEGEFDLIGFIRALPPEVPIGIEAGSKARFAEGVTMEAHARNAVMATRHLIELALEPVSAA